MAYAHSDKDQDVLTSWSLKKLREQFDAYPPETQRAIRADVAHRLRTLHKQSALRRLAGPVYGIHTNE